MRRPRLPVRAVWVQGRYPGDDEVLDRIAEHDEDAASYYSRRGLPGRTWSGGVWRVFREPRREHLSDYYESKGARLR